MAFMAKRCTAVKLLICEAGWGDLRLSSALCQIAAAYRVLGLTTAVYSLRTYLRGVRQMLFEMFVIANANFVPFFVTYYSMCLRFLIKDDIVIVLLWPVQLLCLLVG